MCLKISSLGLSEGNTEIYWKFQHLEIFSHRFLCCNLFARLSNEILINNTSALSAYPLRYCVFSFPNRNQFKCEENTEFFYYISLQTKIEFYSQHQLEKSIDATSEIPLIYIQYHVGDDIELLTIIGNFVYWWWKIYEEPNENRWIIC